jgi:hypothetical protein
MLRPMFQRNWSQGLPLTDWAAAPRQPGLYVIGRAQESGSPIGEPPDTGGKMGGFPANLLPLYIGNSKSVRFGLRSRLYRHFKGRGNKSVAAAAAEGVTLYFSYIDGLDSAGYEALYLHIQLGFSLPYNRRSELTRYLIDTSRALAEMGFYVSDPLGQWPSVGLEGAL